VSAHLGEGGETSAGSPGGEPGQGADPQALEAVAIEVDAALSGEFRRPISRLDWAGPPPEGLLESVFNWLPLVKRRRAVWRRGRALWEERLIGAGLATAPAAQQGEPPPTPVPAPRSPAGAIGDDRPADRTLVDAAAAVFAVPIRATRRRKGTPGAAQRRPRLVGVRGDLRGREFELVQPVTTIGRHPACQLVVADDQTAPQHAQILHREGGWTIRDATRQGETYVNGDPLTGTRELRDGDLIRVGRSELRFESPGG
jgi:Inner membrane component of T3SS, cytoplasmic domain